MFCFARLTRWRWNNRAKAVDAHTNTTSERQFSVLYISKSRVISRCCKMLCTRGERVSVCTLLWERVVGNIEYRTRTWYNPQYPPCDITDDSLVSIYLPGRARCSSLRGPFSTARLAHTAGFKNPRTRLFRSELFRVNCPFSRISSQNKKMLFWNGIFFDASLPLSYLAQ